MLVHLIFLRQNQYRTNLRHLCFHCKPPDLTQVIRRHNVGSPCCEWK